MPQPRALVAARKSVVLAAAARLFLDKGYAAVNIDHIIAAVGGSKSFIYNNYGSKGDLFVAAVEALCADIAAPLATLDTRGMDCAQGLRAIGRCFLELSLSPPSIELHRLVIAERIAFPRIGFVFMEAGPRASYQAVADFMSQQQRARALKSRIEPLELAIVFLGMLNAGYLSSLLSSADAAPSARMKAKRVELVVQLFLNGMKTKAIGKMAAGLDASIEQDRAHPGN